MTPALDEFEDPTERFLSLRLAFLTGSDDDWKQAVSAGGSVGEAGSGAAVSDDRGSGQTAQS
mgnify:CR=1 FL=1